MVVGDKAGSAVFVGAVPGTLESLGTVVEEVSGLPGGGPLLGVPGSVVPSCAETPDTEKTTALRQASITIVVRELIIVPGSARGGWRRNSGRCNRVNVTAIPCTEHPEGGPFPSIYLSVTPGSHALHCEKVSERSAQIEASCASASLVPPVRHHQKQQWG